MSSDISRSGGDVRLPRNYLTILDAVRGVGAGTHLTAQEVYERARKAQPKLGFATVHRGLTRLSDLGYVCKVDVPGAASAVYECAATAHAHFRCTHCGAIDDVEYTIPQDVLSALAARHGVEIRAEFTTFEGRCANCAGSRMNL